VTYSYCMIAVKVKRIQTNDGVDDRTPTVIKWLV